MKKVFEKILKHKKTTIVVCCIAAICIGIYADWAANGKKLLNDYIYTSSDDTPKILGEATLVGSTGDSVGDGDYFAVSLISRERSRDEELELLQEVIDNTESMPETRETAFTQMMQIAAYTEAEANIESLVCAKGFENCLAVVSENGADVIVKTPGLLSNEVAQIKDIAVAQTGLSAENIRIIQKN